MATSGFAPRKPDHTCRKVLLPPDESRSLAWCNGRNWRKSEGKETRFFGSRVAVSEHDALDDFIIAQEFEKPLIKLAALVALSRSASAPLQIEFVQKRCEFVDHMS